MRSFFFFVNEGSASSVNSSNENYYHYVSHTVHHHNFFGNNAFHSLAFFIVDRQVAILIIYSISCFIEMRPYTELVNPASALLNQVKLSECDVHETRNMSDKNRRFGASCAIVKVT